MKGSKAITMCHLYKTTSLDIEIFSRSFIIKTNTHEDIMYILKPILKANNINECKQALEDMCQCATICKHQRHKVHTDLGGGTNVISMDITCLDIPCH